MNANIVLESETAYRHAKSLFQGMTVTWWTTSPWLFEKLSEAGEEVLSLERSVRPGDAHAIGELAVLVAEGITDYIDERLTDLPSGMRAGAALGESLFRTLSTLYYKAWLLEQVLDQSKDKTYVIGDDHFHPPGQLSVILPRKATLFAALCSQSACEGVQVIPFEDVDWEKEARAKMGGVGRSLWERMINLMNMPGSTLRFKIYRHLNNRGRTRDIRRRQDVYILKLNPLIEEAFFPMRRRGLRVKMLPPLEVANSTGDESGALGTFDEFCERYLSIMRQAGRSMAQGPLFEGATKLAASLTLGALKFSRAQAEKIEEYVIGEIVQDPAKNGAIVLTNALSLPPEVMFYHCCKHRRVPVFLVSHGVSAGLSKYHDRMHKIMSFSHGDVFFGYSRGECRPGGNHVVTGAPFSERSIVAKRIQRSLARRHLRVPPDKRLIMYVANLYSNNAVDLPYGGTNDWFEHCLKKTIVQEVFGRLSDHCILKLYPTQRYADPDPFLGMSQFPNVDIVQWSEFRYLRSACDVVIVDMVQSAFGWAWSTGVPLILLDTPYYPLLPDVKKELEEAIFIIPVEREKWGQELLNLLELPGEELARVWRKKEAARLRTERERIMGPGTEVGEVLAQVVSERKAAHRVLNG